MNNDGHRGLDQGEIAITSVAGRFPNAASPQVLWQRILAGEELIGDFAIDDARPALRAGESYVSRGAFLANPQLFDYGFFHISPREAWHMDPQQRMLLEVCHEALELAGYARGRDAGIASVFIGTRHSGWQPAPAAGAGATDDMLRLVGNSPDAMASRIAYKLHCTGPAINVATFCSGSLVALHLACQSLHSGESDLALVGAACVRFPSHTGYVYHPGGILSPTGRIHAFDQAANGTLFADGVAAVVLRRLDDAQRRGEPILAVIKGSAINNDGALRAGYSAPAVDGQAAVIGAAWRNANLAPRQAGLLEAHGTGTVVGDGIELRALLRVFAATPSRGCALGSLKTNLGHADCVSGLAGLIKTIMAVQQGIIPPTLNCSAPVAALTVRNTPFYLPTAARPWDTGAALRLAGVSSFGIGGTNAHVVVAQPPPPPVGTTPRAGLFLFPFSAASPAILAAIAHNLRSHLTDNPRLSPADIAFTLQRGRRHHAVRRVVLARGVQGLIAGLALTDGVTIACRQPVDEWQINLAQAWQRGKNIDWSRVAPQDGGQRLALPAYPFARTWPERGNT